LSSIFQDSLGLIHGRAARYIFKTKILYWVNFGETCYGRCCYILWQFDLFYSHLADFTYGYLVYFIVIWYIFTVLVSCTKIDLAALIRSSARRKKSVKAKFQTDVASIFCFRVANVFPKCGGKSAFVNLETNLFLLLQSCLLFFRHIQDNSEKEKEGGKERQLD
jgi:hypothetical protein